MDTGHHDVEPMDAALNTAAVVGRSCTQIIVEMLLSPRRSAYADDAAHGDDAGAAPSSLSQPALASREASDALGALPEAMVSTVPSARRMAEVLSTTAPTPTTPEEALLQRRLMRGLFVARGLPPAEHSDDDSSLQVDLGALTRVDSELPQNCHSHPVPLLQPASPHPLVLDTFFPAAATDAATLPDVTSVWPAAVDCGPGGEHTHGGEVRVLVELTISGPLRVFQGIGVSALLHVRQAPCGSTLMRLPGPDDVDALRDDSDGSVRINVELVLAARPGLVQKEVMDEASGELSAPSALVLTPSAAAACGLCRVSQASPSLVGRPRLAGGGGGAGDRSSLLSVGGGSSRLLGSGAGSSRRTLLNGHPFAIDFGRWMDDVVCGPGPGSGGGASPRMLDALHIAGGMLSFCMVARLPECAAVIADMSVDRLGADTHALLHVSTPREWVTATASAAAGGSSATMVRAAHVQPTTNGQMPLLHQAAGSGDLAVVRALDAWARGRGVVPAWSSARGPGGVTAMHIVSALGSTRSEASEVMLWMANCDGPAKEAAPRGGDVPSGARPPPPRPQRGGSVELEPAAAAAAAAGSSSWVGIWQRLQPIKSVGSATLCARSSRVSVSDSPGSSRLLSMCASQLQPNISAVPLAWLVGASLVGAATMFSRVLVFRCPISHLLLAMFMSYWALLAHTLWARYTLWAKHSTSQPRCPLRHALLGAYGRVAHAAAWLLGPNYGLVLHLMRVRTVVLMDLKAVQASQYSRWAPHKWVLLACVGMGTMAFEEYDTRVAVLVFAFAHWPAQYALMCNLGAEPQRALSLSAVQTVVSMSVKMAATWWRARRAALVRPGSFKKDS
ncbi:hypothetical protein FOA52_004346 [Chlamydomonas sp. UWO 241]|nr:hypothetical protein FOA52_004346 [Chlamydomonas sp. UWO 241]